MSDDLNPCAIETAHCEDCGGTKLRALGFGFVCAECGGDIFNPDECEGGH